MSSLDRIEQLTDENARLQEEITHLRAHVVMLQQEPIAIVPLDPFIKDLIRAQAFADASYVFENAVRIWRGEPADSPERRFWEKAYREISYTMKAWAEDPHRIDGHLEKRKANGR